MKSFAKPTKKSFWMMTVPRSPISSSTTPFQPSRPASVTTNDGTPSLVMISPWSRPIARPPPRAITSVGTVPTTWWPSGRVSSATHTPATAET